MKGVGAGGDYTAGRDRSGTRNSVQNYTFAHVSFESLFSPLTVSSPSSSSRHHSSVPTRPGRFRTSARVRRTADRSSARQRKERHLGRLGSGARDSSRSLGVLSARPGTEQFTQQSKYLLYRTVLRVVVVLYLSSRARISSSCSSPGPFVSRRLRRVCCWDRIPLEAPREQFSAGPEHPRKLHAHTRA